MSIHSFFVCVYLNGVLDTRTAPQSMNNNMVVKEVLPELIITENDSSIMLSVKVHDSVLCDPGFTI